MERRQDERWRAPGDILLVSCYEPGFQPLAVASPAAFLSKAGYAPLCLDLAVEELSDDGAGVDRLRQARMVAISTPMHTALALGLRVAERVRAVNPLAHICFYGLYAHLNAAYLARAVDRRPIADTVLGPECEESLVALADALREARPPPAPPARLHRLPFLPPAREHLPPLEKYARLLVAGERRVTGYVEATRGCLYLCRHCPIPPFYQGRFFAVPAALVLEDIRGQVAAGARHITFGDPDFLNSAKHSLGIVRRMHAAHSDLTFSFTAKVEHIIAHRTLFPELAALGCVFVVSAVESLSDRILAVLDKRHTRADVHAALDIVRGAGLSLRPTFVAFTPWTTLQDYLDLCELVASHDLQDEVDPVQLAIRLLVPPGSLLLGRPELAPFLDAGPLDERALTHRWTHPDPRMDRLYETIASLAEDAARDGEDPSLTFARIHEIAARADGRAAPAGRDRSGPRRPAPPRLSEPWFCCAQPTRSQLRCSGDRQQGSDSESQVAVRGPQ
jgi:Radical SAM superfamily